MADMLTAKEAAARLGVPAKTVYKLTAERLLACYRIGRAVRISADDLEAYMKSCYKAARPPENAAQQPRQGAAKKDPKETAAQTRRRARAMKTAWGVEEGYTGLDCLNRTGGRKYG